jgi:hypothetical protein
MRIPMSTVEAVRTTLGENATVTDVEESAHLASVAYAKAAAARDSIERRVAVGATVSSSLATLAILSSPGLAIRIIAGILSAAAAGLTALQKYGKEAPSSELLKRSGQYADLRYEMQVKRELALGPVTKRMAVLIGLPPIAGEKYWNRARAQVGNRLPGA